MQIFHVGRSTQAAILLFAVLTNPIGTPRLEAQETPRPKPAPTDTAPLVTDRPDFTEGAVLVPRGTFQFEMGTTYQRHDVGYAVSGPELLLRYGLRRRVELRFGLPDYARESLPNNIASGFGSTYLGAKLALGSLAGVGEVAIIPAVSVSVGNGTFTSRSVDPELKLVSYRDLGTLGDLSLMSFGQWTSGDTGRFVAFQQTASFGHDLTQHVAMFLEYAGSFARAAPPDHVAHTGIAVAIGSLKQVDVHGGLSLNGDHRKPFLGVGFAERF